MKLFIAPHNDDEVLFGCFSLLREKPLVLIVTDSARQSAKGISAKQRHQETQTAMKLVGCETDFLGIPDADLESILFGSRMLAFLGRFRTIEQIFAPAHEPNGNRDHNLIADFGFEKIAPTVRYLTYTIMGKSRSERQVTFERDWPLLKLQALACYKSQILEPSTRDHFLRDQYEYYAA